MESVCRQKKVSSNKKLLFFWEHFGVNLKLVWKFYELFELSDEICVSMDVDELGEFT